MKILFDNISIIDSLSPGGTVQSYVAVDGERIQYVGNVRPEGSFDRVIDGRAKLLIPGFYNAHCHSAMSLFRGIGEDLPLKRWLDEKILPAEDKLTGEAVYLASLLSVAEMISCGIVSFTDMYFFCEYTAKAVIESGMKCNITRSIVSFDDSPPEKDRRVNEALSLYREYNGAADGRIIVDFGLHAQYTNTPAMCSYVATLAKEHNTGIQIHLSETESEHLKCIEKYHMTPTQFFKETGVFDVPVSAAHCVWVSGKDMEILKESGATAVHNPVSNLKLGSGVMPLRRLLDAGVNVALGTDGAASNNRLDIMIEANVAALIHKGVNYSPDIITGAEMLPLMSENGAKSQRRPDSGKIEAGYRADLAVISLDKPHSYPFNDATSSLLYSLNSGDISITVADGRILYENGEYTTLDIEKLKHDFSALFRKLY